MHRDSRSLRIAYLLEDCSEPWGGVEMVLREAHALQQRGHRVTLFAKTPEPEWTTLEVPYRHVPDFDRLQLEPQDLCIGTYFPSIEPARLAGAGVAVHYCQGYEGDSPHCSESLHQVDAAYHIEGVRRIVISPFLQERLRERYGIEALRIPYGVREDLFCPGDVPDGDGPVRVALVGPWDVAWKDIPTGVAAARRVHERRGGIELVRVSPVPFGAAEREAWGDMPVESHVRLAQAEMPELYRSCSIFLGTSNGGAEGFFLPAMEAMACGVPAVLSDIACFRHYDERHDYASFVPAGDVERFAMEIERYVDEEPLRRARRERGLEVAAGHTFTRHLDALEHSLCELVSEAESSEDRHEDGALLDRQRARQSWLQHALAPHNDLQTSLSRLDSLVAIEPEYIKARHWRALLLHHLGDRDAAREAYLQALDLDPRSPGLHRRLGQVCAELGRLDEAHEALAAAFAAGHPGANLCLELALVCMHAGRWDEGALWLQRGRDRQPIDARGHELLAQIQQRIATSGFARSADG